MKKYVTQLTHYFISEVHGKRSLVLFGMLVYAWFLLQAVVLFFWHEQLWGADKLFFRHGFPDTFIENFFFQLVYESGRAPVVFALHMVCAFLSMVSFHPAFYRTKNKWSLVFWNTCALGVRLCTWVSGLMLFYAAIEAFDGGMLLMLLMAFYCSFAFVHTANSYLIAVTNAARIACLVQVCVVYLTASLYKLGGTHWIDGSALYYTLHIELFSSNWWQSFTENNYFITQLFTWLGLAYQVLFPLMVWVKRVQKIWLLVGIAFHLFIAVVLGLWGFGLGMMICYVVFWREQKIKDGDL